MTPERWREIEELFARALDHPPADRAAFVAGAAGSDADLRRELETLLAQVDRDDTLRHAVQRAAADLGETALRAQIGRRVGPYRVVRPIGAGGMGAVFLAERDDGAFRRQVALKLLHAGPATPHLAQRFRDERQVLASLDHPGIVRLLDGGTTDDGLPYLAMEYVEGVTLGVHARALALRRKVELVVALAQALQFAHQRLIVHRDIKPSNVLIDATGAPKLLDFGIAKILDRSAPRASYTGTGVGLFTVEYASPEQVRGEPVSVATDVYGLGAVLYELLTGALPHPAAANLAETLDNICRRDPPRPSTIAPLERRRELAGDLDSIALKALQRDPGRRYASAAQFADDLQRYLDGLPVSARDATFRYRAGKLLARHRGKLALAVAMTGALATATIVSLAQARRADAQAARAEQDKRALLRARGIEELERGRNNRALPYLVEALREGDDTAAARLLIAEARRPYERTLARVAVAEGASELAVSPDGQRLAVSTLLGRVLFFDATGRLEAQVAALPSGMSGLGFSDDGARLVARTDAGTVYAWDTRAAYPRGLGFVPMPPSDSGLLVAFSRAQDAVIAVGGDGVIRVLDLAAGTVRARLNAPEAGRHPAVAAASRDGAWVAIGDADGTIEVWSTGEGPSRRLVGHTGTIRALRVSRDGAQLWSAADDHTVRAWNGERAGAIIAVLHGDLTALTLSPDERELAIGTSEGAVEIRDAATGAVRVALAGHPHDAIRNLRYGDGGRLLVSIGGDATFRVWDAASGAPIVTLEANAGAGAAGHSPPGALDAAIASDGHAIATLEARGLRRSRLDRAPLVRDLDVGVMATAAAYAPDERTLAVAGAGLLGFWTPAGAPLARVDLPGTTLWDVTWSPRGDRVLVAGDAGLARIYDAHGTALRDLTGHRDRVHRGSWSPRGDRVVTVSSDHTARIWDPDTGAQLRSLDHPHAVMAASWSPDGARIATACRDRMLRIWDATSGALLTTIDAGGMQLLDVTFSPDGTALASTGRDGDAAIWDIASGTRRTPLEGHTDVVITAVWSPDGALLASAGDNGVVAIWDVRTGEQLATRIQPGEPLGLQWTRDGEHLLVACSDHHVRVWNVQRDRASLAELDAFLARDVPYRLVGTRLERVDLQ